MTDNHSKCLKTLPSNDLPCFNSFIADQISLAKNKGSPVYDNDKIGNQERHWCWRGETSEARPQRK
jgi:hypothetical protein